MTRNNLNRLLVSVAASVGMILVGVANGQIRTATIPKGTVRGGVVTPSAGPVVTPSYPTSRPGGFYGGYCNHYGVCGCYAWGGGWYRYDRDSGYYYDYGAPIDGRLADRLREQGLTSAASPGVVYAPPGYVPVAPSEPADTGARAMEDGRYADAANLYSKAHEDQKQAEAAATEDESVIADRSAQRLMAVALIGERRFEDATHAMVAAYDADESLTGKPISDDIFKDDLELRRLVRRAVSYANRVGTHDAWFTVAILMQAEGRHTLASKMMDRADSIRTEEATDAADATSE
ncbi:MAG: hypothetical protein RIB32_03405 [Phycisphaerales bacterium]